MRSSRKSRNLEDIGRILTDPVLFTETMLGQRNTSLVQWHSLALICARKASASGESQISKGRLVR